MSNLLKMLNPKNLLRRESASCQGRKHLCRLPDWHRSELPPSKNLHRMQALTVPPWGAAWGERGTDWCFNAALTRTCPIFGSRRDAEITKSIYRYFPLLNQVWMTSSAEPRAVTSSRSTLYALIATGPLDCLQLRMHRTWERPQPSPSTQARPCRSAKPTHAQEVKR